MKFSSGKEDRSQVVAMLKKVPLFSSLKEKQLKSMAESFREHSYERGEVIETEGDKAISFYLIKEGSVEVRKGKKHLATLNRGQFFGEMSLLDSQPRSATVVAIEPTNCLLMTVWNWNSFLETQPKLAIGVLRELARRLRETNNALSE